MEGLRRVKLLLVRLKGPVKEKTSQKKCLRSLEFQRRQIHRPRDKTNTVERDRFLYFAHITLSKPVLNSISGKPCTNLNSDAQLCVVTVNSTSSITQRPLEPITESIKWRKSCARTVGVLKVEETLCLIISTTSCCRFQCA